MYCVAFNEVSLVISIFVMGVMLHPLIAIPLAQCSKMFCKISYDLCIKKVKNKVNAKTCRLSISIILYMGLISLNQMYLFSMWVRFREDKINENCNNSTLSDIECANSFKTSNSYGSFSYDQCDCKEESENGEDACVNTDNTSDTFLEDIFSTIPPDYIPFILLGYTIILIIFHIIQNCVPCLRLPNSVPMDEFFLVQSCQAEVENDSEDFDGNNYGSMRNEYNNTKNMDNTNKKLNQRKLSKKGKQNSKHKIFKTLSIVVALIFLVSLYSSVFIFYPALYEWKVSCNEGFYDIHPESDILKCTGNIPILNLN